ncbi:hypothetical protein AeMF1_005968 [Aphanomyces euteiches]|nr:hypothetical protein AeMF1_005968 [Aphanomyces euteiches]KAH9182931.1 hypothetical protein AeNC1_015091 [Aphanomyces euteiches]
MPNPRSVCLESIEQSPTTPPPPTLVHLFNATAQRHPNAIALSCPRAYSTIDHLTYSQLQAKVQRMAMTLQKTQPSVIGILLNKSMELTMAILATTFAGATWLPFDPDAPSDRVAVCLQDAGASALLFDDAHATPASQLLKNVPSCNGVLFSDLEKSTTASDIVNLRAPSPETPAYYIYTSGTTGTPKGISISHRAAATFACSESSVLKLTERDVVWNGFSPAFDMWVEETWCAFAQASHVAIAQSGQWQYISNLCLAWETRQVTVIMAVPTLMAMVCNEGAVPACVRLINMGGEACPPALVSRLSRPNLELFNTYGPSETTVTATYSIVIPDKPITIGKPLPYYHALILKETDDGTDVIPLALEPGVVGELAIGGPCVGQGYVGRPDLTHKKFVPHPTRSGETIYRSGDLVSLNADGDIVFIGRIDTQVKYRGFRIELGEIEEKLSAQPGVLTAAVILAKGSDVDDSLPDRLEAYVVMEPGLPMDIALFRKRLAGILMAYMIPDVFVQLGEHEMPRLLSGKIDKKGLAALSKTNRAKESHVVPVERKVVSHLDFVLDVLCKLFPHLTLSITAESDIFDDLGAHSLLAATFASNLRKGHPNLTDNPFKFIGLADVYSLRTPQRLVFKFAQKNVPNAADQQRAFHQVTTLRYFMCGVVQTIFLVPLLGMYGATTLGPYIASSIVYTNSESLIYSLLATYVMYVIGPIYTSIMAVVLKWILLGKVQPGDYPVFGWFYIRWWFVTRLNELVDKTLWTDSYIMVLWLRLWGARVGNHVHISSFFTTPCMDLITIGDNVSIGREVLLGCDIVDQGLLKLRRITIGNNVFVGTSVSLSGNVHIQEGAEVMSMSGISEGLTIPACQVWSGSPATFQAPSSSWRLSAIPPPWRLHLLFVCQVLIVVFVMPLFHVIPMIPISLWTRTISGGSLAMIIPFGLASGTFYVVAMALMIVATKYIVLGKVEAGEYSTNSFFFLRKWLFDGMMQTSLQTLHTLYAALYVVPFLRLLGATVGSRSEISTASHVVLDLLHVGEECFVADRVLLGDDHIRGYTLTLEPTVMGKRSFLGNASLVPQGSHLASNTLVGVFSSPPEKIPLNDGESCFGLPAILMPTRRNVTDAYDTSLLFYPSSRLYCLRLIIEGIRIVFAPALVSMGIWFSVVWIDHNNYGGDHVDISEAASNIIPLLPMYYAACFVAPGIVLSVILKWCIVGIYKPVEWPMWSLSVWRSEFITSVMEHLSPLVLFPLIGTPYLPMIYRLNGCKIGRRCYMGGVDVPEFDCIEIGDDCAFNPRGFSQTHLFEDRVMKLGQVRVGCNSVAMKGEDLTRGYTWTGFPVDIQPEPPAHAASVETPVPNIATGDHALEVPYINLVSPKN